MNKFSFFLLFTLPICVFAGKSESMLCAGSAGKTVLIVMDMQPGFTTPEKGQDTPANLSKIDQLITAQVEAIKKAKQYHIPVLFIEYKYYEDDHTIRLLKDAIGDYGNVQTIQKDQDGMFSWENFYRDDLVDYVKKNNIGTLIMTGVNGGACMLQSIMAAVNRNCTVYAYSKGIADLNYPEFIYPYMDHYKDIQPKCSDCKFKEVSSIDEIVDAMARASRVSTAAPTSKQNEGSAK